MWQSVRGIRPSVRDLHRLGCVNFASETKLGRWEGGRWLIARNKNFIAPRRAGIQIRFFFFFFTTRLSLKLYILSGLGVLSFLFCCNFT
jgi:hypothetical protein